MSKLRTQIHILEKRIGEEKTEFFKMISARNLYYEARKRKLLNSDEINWCEHVLFGKPRQIKKRDADYRNATDNILDTIKIRRSIRSWNESVLDNEVFEELVNAARWAPSSCNRQPWHFIVTREKEKIKVLSKIKGQKFLKDAPYCILVLINENSYGNKSDFKYFSGLDAGSAIQNLLLKAEQMELGACWVNWKPESISKRDNKRVKRLFDISNNFHIISIIPIGKIKERPKPPGRKNVSDILDFESME